jgi:tol-pal system protein YbgF
MVSPVRALLSLPCLLAAAMPVQALSTSERLDLLERRVARVTELTLQVDELRAENRQLRGQVEDLGYKIEQLERKQRDIYQDIDQRLGAMPGGAPVTGGSPATAAPGPSAAAVRSAPTPSAGASRQQIEAQYQAAYTLLSPQQKRYDEAAKAFEDFVAKYPNDRLTPNAQYWLGEAYYVSQRNKEALQAFGVVVDKYPDSTKAPGALFKVGRLQQAAGEPDAARASYRRVVSDYPDAPAAGLARQKLEQLGG